MIVETESFYRYSIAEDMEGTGWYVGNPDVISMLPAGGVDGAPGIHFAYDGSLVEAIEGASTFDHYGVVGLTVASNDTYIVGFTIRFDSFNNVTTGTSQCAIFEFGGATPNAQNIMVRMDGAGVLWVTRGGTVDVGSYGGILLNTDYHFEIKGVVNGSVGSIDFRIDGVTVISVENVDTQESGLVETVRLGANEFNSEYAPNGLEYTISNLYILDDAAGPSDFLGPFARVEYVPVNGDGASTQFTPSAGADNSLMLDDAGSHDFDTTRNVSSTDAHKDTFDVAALSEPTEGEIHGLNIKMAAMKDDALSRTAFLIQRHNAVEEDGAAKTLTESYAYYNTIFITNPDTAAQWQKSEFGTLQIGYKNGSP